MNGRTVIPPGKAGLIILAAAMVPLVVKKCKPLLRAVGEGFAKAGEAMRKAAEEPHDPVKTEKAAPPEATKPKTAAKPRAAARAKPRAKPKTKPAEA